MTSALDRAVDAQLTELWRQQLVEARYKAGITQYELAQLVGVSQCTVSFWETGRSMPDLKHWQAWGGALRFELQLVPAKPEESK